MNTHCPKLNPARFDALHHAQARANRSQEPMLVYVGPPGLGLNPEPHWQGGRNVWFVRSAAEGAPEGADLFTTVEPEA